MEKLFPSIEEEEKLINDLILCAKKTLLERLGDSYTSEYIVSFRKSTNKILKINTSHNLEITVHIFNNNDITSSRPN